MNSLNGSLFDPTKDAHWQERSLCSTTIKTYSTDVDLERVFTQPQQPSSGAKDNPEMQHKNEATEGLFEPLLLEPHQKLPGKFRIIDGERRWTNSKTLVE